MAVLAQFDTLKFEISSSSAMLLQGLKMSSECETEDEIGSSQAYVKAKNGKPIEINFTAIFDAALGIDVESNIEYLMNAAQRSAQSYFYVAGKKIFPFMLMMVKAETEEIMLSPSGRMVKTKANVVLKQSSKDWISGTPPAESGGSSSGGGSTTSSGKASTTTTQPATMTPNASVTAKNIDDMITKGILPANNTATKTTSTAAAVTSAAKTTSTAKKTTSTVTKSTSLTSDQKARAAAKEAALLGI